MYSLEHLGYCVWSVPLSYRLSLADAHLGYGDKHKSYLQSSEIKKIAVIHSGHLPKATYSTLLKCICQNKEKQQYNNIVVVGTVRMVIETSVKH